MHARCSQRLCSASLSAAFRHRNHQISVSFLSTCSSAPCLQLAPVEQQEQSAEASSKSSTKNGLARAVVDHPLDSSVLCYPEGLWAVERLGKGKWSSERDRQDGRIPGYVYKSHNPDEHVLVALDKYQVLCLWSLMGHQKFMRTVFDMEVYDGLGSRKILYQNPVLPRRVNFDSRKSIANVGFTWAPPGEMLQLDSPVFIIGEDDCLGVKKGGKFKIQTSYVPFLCLPKELPLYVEVRVDTMDIGEKILVGDICSKVPINPRIDPSLIICAIE